MAGSSSIGRPELAWRACVDRIEVESLLVGMQEIKNIGLNKRKGVVRLRLDVHANHVKTSAVIANSCTTSTTKQVKQLGS